jgi:hypothetical protein
MKATHIFLLLSILLLPIKQLTAQTVYYDNQSKLYGITNEFGKDILKPTYKEMRVFVNGLCKFKQNEKWGIINEKGVVVLPAEFDTEYDFSDEGINEGLFAAKKNGKYGYYSEKGILVIANKFDWTMEFCEGMAWVKVGEKYSFINKKGDYITTKWFDDVNIVGGISYGIDEKRVYDKDGGYYTQGEPDYYKINKEGVVNLADNQDALRKNKNTHLAWCDKSNAPIQKLTAYNTVNLYGYKDQTGKVVIEAQYSYVFGFSEGLSLVQKAGVYSFINETGKDVIQINPNWKWIQGTNVVFQNGLIEFEYLVSKPDDEIQKWEYILINKKGEIIKKMAEGVFPSWNNG